MPVNYRIGSGTTAMILVVDASAIAAVLFDEPEGATVRAHRKDETLLAPALLDYELANAACQRVKRRRAGTGEIVALLALLPALGIHRVDVPAAEAAALATQTGLSAYDAAYLWLAMIKDAELVTLNRRLAEVNAALRGDS